MSARPDLCGGQSAMVVPRSTVIVDGISEESTFAALDAPERKFWSTVPLETILSGSGKRQGNDICVMLLDCRAEISSAGAYSPNAPRRTPTSRMNTT